MPAAPKNSTGSMPAVMPCCETVSMRTVWPDAMRSTGGAFAGISPQVTLPGVERRWASTGCGRTGCDLFPLSLEFMRALQSFFSSAYHLLPTCPPYPACPATQRATAREIDAMPAAFTLPGQRSLAA